MSYFSFEPEEILVVHDDLELEFGEIKKQQGGGLKGHNGLKSIKTYVKSADFYRLRFGIGRPGREPVASYVLSGFTEEEQNQLPSLLSQASTIITQNK